MPYIHIMAYEGRSKETQIKAAEAIIAAAAEAMDTPTAAFTILYEDCPKDDFQETFVKTEIEPRKDKIIYTKGAPVE